MSVDPSQQSTETAQHHQRSDDPAAESEAALPGRLLTVKPCQVSHGHGEQGQGAGAQAGERSDKQNDAQAQRPWLLQGVVQQLLTAARQVGQGQVEEGDGGLPEPEETESRLLIPAAPLSKNSINQFSSSWESSGMTG